MKTHPALGDSPEHSPGAEALRGVRNTGQGAWPGLAGCHSPASSQDGQLVLQGRWSPGPHPRAGGENTAPTGALHWLTGLGLPHILPAHSAGSPALWGYEARRKNSTRMKPTLVVRGCMVSKGGQLHSMVSLHLQRRKLG